MKLMTFLSSSVAQLRSNYNEDYIAYHQPHYRKGHKEARENYEKKASILSGHAQDHRNWKSVRFSFGFTLAQSSLCGKW